MKTLAAAVAALLLAGAAPALAMTCCGGGKGRTALCGKGAMAMSHGMPRGQKGKKGCCCEGMSAAMSRRG
ncbi:hypothetical protein [Methylobacterium oryzisoli]|uniref:hypothetical protein n=1 Tax=Methylobacterium oryzisoli TaxID=3385502 RepID=UPI003892176D